MGTALRLGLGSLVRVRVKSYPTTTQSTLLMVVWRRGIALIYYVGPVSTEIGDRDRSIPVAEHLFRYITSGMLSLRSLVTSILRPICTSNSVVGHFGPRSGGILDQSAGMRQRCTATPLAIAVVGAWSQPRHCQYHRPYSRGVHGVLCSSSRQDPG